MNIGTYLDIALIVLSVALVAAIVLQSKSAGLGGLTGGDTGGVFRARRGIERTLFKVTIGLSGTFFLVTMASVMLGG